MIVGVNFIEHSRKKNSIHRKKRTYYFKTRFVYSKSMVENLQNSIIWILAKRPADPRHPKKYPQIVQITEVIKNNDWIAAHPDRHLNSLSTLYFMRLSPTVTKRFVFNNNGELNAPTIEDGFKDLDHDYKLIFIQAKQAVQ